MGLVTVRIKNTGQRTRTDTGNYVGLNIVLQ